MSVLNVQIVRPKKNAAQHIGTILGFLTGYLLSGWILMLCLGAIGWWQPSYWHAVLAVIAVRATFPTSNYLGWTKAAT